MAAKDFFMKMVGKNKGNKKSISPSKEVSSKFSKSNKDKSKKGSIFSKKEED